MNITSQPLYRDVFKLANMLLDDIEHMAVKHRKTLGDRIMDSAYNCVTYLHFAYSIKDEKQCYQNKFRTELSLLKTFVRIAQERNYIPLKKSILISEICENISRQLAGWIKSTKIISEGSTG